MRNKFPGVCYLCNKMVDKDDGFFELIPKEDKKDKQKWRLQHDNCSSESKKGEYNEDKVNAVS